ncbi:DUF6906 family protein [Bacillus infantis]
MASANLDPKNYLVVKNLPGELHVVHRKTTEIKVIPV